MKKIILLLFVSSSVNAQFLDPNLLKVNGLNLFSTKEEIVEQLGDPNRIYEPNYECGFLSSDEQGKEIYCLEYSGVRFTGNVEDGYMFEELRLLENKLIQLQYGDSRLSLKTSIEELENILGIKPNDESREDGIIRAYFEKSDDAILFTFRNGGLRKLEYWSPC